MNPYEVLNVASDADEATIQKAFKELSLKFHPDKANASTAPLDGVESKKEQEAREQHNHEQYIRIVEARDTLLDATKRRKYDQQEGNTRKDSNHKTSKPSDTGKTGKLEEDTMANLGLDITTTLERLEDIGDDLSNTLSSLRNLAPRSPAPSLEYPEVLSSFNRIIARNTSISNRIKEARERLLSQEKDSTARAVCESALEEANTYIQQVEDFNFEVEEVLISRDPNDPLDFLYRDIFIAIPRSMRR
ncbi:hypothetical protein FHL15_005352 [Xylaria flabelliformis]|uniref:J domain-containing protein n=1 Tax=Xylaria flabelliformis TaxID=2512241 RepID=A0A553I0F2_9PEZI|nr:hypothetical protein FHL15_005352 [Xylaria flabelliformis]